MDGKEDHLGRASVQAIATGWLEVAAKLGLVSLSLDLGAIEVDQFRSGFYMKFRRCGFANDAGVDSLGVVFG